MESTSQFTPDNNEIIQITSDTLGIDKHLDHNDDTQKTLKENPLEESVEWDDTGEEEEDEEARMSLGLVGKIWTKHDINSNAFMTVMKNVWQPIHGLDISSIGDNNCASVSPLEG